MSRYIGGEIVGGSGDFPHCELFNQCHAARSNVSNSASVDQWTLAQFPMVSPGTHCHWIREQRAWHCFDIDTENRPTWIGPNRGGWA